MDAAADPTFARFHGRDGELRVERQRARYPILDAFAAACREAGIPARADFNDGDNEGVGYFEVNQRGGFRWNAARAFLAPARGRPNLVVRTGAEVARLVLERRPAGLACTGIELAGGERVAARRGVVLAAGAVNSPKLLQLSGLGPAALLREHGVEVVADLPAVGGNLQDHLQLRTIWKVTAGGTLNELAASWRGKAAIALEYALRRTGPMSAAPSQLGAFTRSAPGRNHADLEFHVQPLSLDAFGEPLHAFPAITASVCNLNPTSRGRVDIKSGRAGDAPAIRPNYLSTDADRKVAADSLRVTRRVCAPAGAGGLCAGGVEAGGGAPDRRGAGAGGRRRGLDDLPPRGHDRDGPRRRPGGGARQPDADAGRPRRTGRRAPGGRRRRDAGDRQRQHQRPGADDGREGGALDRRGGVSRALSHRANPGNYLI